MNYYVIYACSCSAIVFSVSLINSLKLSIKCIDYSDGFPLYH